MEAWNRTHEREFRDDVLGVLDLCERRFAQLKRMSERGGVGQRPRPAEVRKLERAYVEQGFHVCAICDRDHWSPTFEELTLDGRPVCWVCGDEHDPQLTAEVLADAVRTNIDWLSPRWPDYFVGWVALLQDLGMEEGAIDLHRRIQKYERSCSLLEPLGSAEAWFATRAAN